MTSARQVPDIRQKLEDNLAALNDLASTQRSSVGQLKKDKAQCQKAVKRLRQELEDFFDNLETDMESAVNSKHAEVRDTLDRNEQKCEEMSYKLRAIKEELTTAVKNDDKKIDDVIKKAEAENRKGDDVIREMHAINIRLQFLANSELVEMMKTTKSLGTIQTGHMTGQESHIQRYVMPAQTPESFVKQPTVKRAEVMGTFSIRFDDDERDCDIIGSTVLPDGSILFADIGNNKVKMVDRDLKHVCAIHLCSFPYEISTCGPQGNSVFVTLPNERKLQEIRFSGRALSLGKSFTTEGECRSISWCSPGLVVSVDTSEGDQIHIFNEQGKVVKRIQKDARGKALFRCPYNSAVLDEGRAVLVSNRESSVHSVVSIDLTTGSQLFKYTDSDLVWPRGLTKDDRRSLYIVGGESHNVHQITDDGKKIRCLLTNTEGLKWPRSIAYLYDGRLLISNKWSNDVMIFQLS